MNNLELIQKAIVKGINCILPTSTGTGGYFVLFADSTWVVISAGQKNDFFGTYFDSK
jgi:hypothetical protein